jgi:hypothetical protein
VPSRKTSWSPFSRGARNGFDRAAMLERQGGDYCRFLGVRFSSRPDLRAVPTLEPLMKISAIRPLSKRPMPPV